MPDETDNIIKWPKSATSRLPLDNFMARAQKHRVDILTSQDSVLYALDLFSEGEGIWPEDCDEVINTMHQVSAPVQEFCELLNSHAQLPIVVSPLRYPLMKTLYHLDALANELSLLLTLFRSVCRLSSKQVFTQRREIHLKLKSLVQGLEEIDQVIDKLPERVDFQVRLLSKI